MVCRFEDTEFSVVVDSDQHGTNEPENGCNTQGGKRGRNAVLVDKFPVFLEDGLPFAPDAIPSQILDGRQFVGKV